MVGLLSIIHDKSIENNHALNLSNIKKVKLKNSYNKQAKQNVFLIIKLLKRSLG
jgi:hypothetical protein